MNERLHILYFVYLSQFKLEDEPVMVIVTSSTGDGEPPSNANKFWRKIRREKNSKFLSHMKYTVLGLDFVIIIFLFRIR
jgi:sulfite reductase alpha subunit-like flavoprotein